MDHALNTVISSAYKDLKVQETFLQFQKDSNTEDMFKYIYNDHNILADAFLILKLPINIDCKDEVTSNKLREEGNIFYKRNKFRKALEAYNKCILSAPHPRLPCVKRDTNEYTSLALGYGNRSAVLFQLKEYSISIRDIDISLNLSNFPISQFKLKERKAKCLIAIEKYEEAHVLLETCRTRLNNIELEEKVKEYYNKSLSNLLQQTQSDQGRKRGKNQNKSQMSKYENIKDGYTSSSDDFIFAYNNPTPPSLDDEPNPTIPAFSCALKLQHSPDQGRFVVATRDIKPGDVLAVETAFISYLDPEEPDSSFSFCSFCLARCAAPLPCHECTNVVFCNEECRSLGWHKFHMIECPVYHQLQILGKGLAEAYRIIAGQSIDELKVIVPKIKKEEQRTPLQQMLNEDLVCDSNSYRSVYFLESNIKTMNTELLFTFSVKAFIMTQLLIRTNCFFNTDEGNQILPTNVEDIIFIGSLFIHHACGINCNSYRICETRIFPNKANCSELAKVGTGTYIAESLFNHSCFPSAKIFFYGNVGVCRAISFIPSGDQVTVCYKYIYFARPDTTTRRDYLSLAYSFICNCEACLGEYDMTYSDMDDFLIDRPYPRLKQEFERSKSLISDLDNLVDDNRSMIMDLTSIRPNFEVDDYLDLVLETTNFFGRYVEMPDQLYIQLSVIFRKIFEHRSSCYFIHKSLESSPETSKSDLD